VPEFIDPVFRKSSSKRSFATIENERFGLVSAKQIRALISHDESFKTAFTERDNMHGRCPRNLNKMG
jgi:hypothetical protein